MTKSLATNPPSGSSVTFRASTSKPLEANSFTNLFFQAMGTPTTLPRTRKTNRKKRIIPPALCNQRMADPAVEGRICTAFRRVPNIGVFIRPNHR